MLPGGFILCVVSSLDLAHFYNLVVSHSFCGIHNLNWLFAVGQIST
jgi:hypothetical protein